MQLPKKIKIKYFDPEMPKLEKTEKGDWIDLRCAENIFLEPDEFKLIPLGVAMEIPEGYEAHIAPRSSTFKNFKITQTNSPGIVDNMYCGDADQWFLPVISHGFASINKYDRICQFRLVEKMPSVVFEEVETLSNTNRGGHGSTGVN